MYNTYSIIEWLEFFRNNKIKRFPKEINTKENAIIMTKYVIENILKCQTREDILSLNSTILRNEISMRTTQLLSEHYIDLIIQLYPEHDFKIYEFKPLPKGYIRNKENADIYLKYVVSNLIDKFNITNLRKELPFYLKSKNLIELGENTLLNCITLYKHYSSFYEWVNKIFPEVGFTEEDFKYIIACDGKSKCNSIQEKKIFDYIFQVLKVPQIKCIGTNRKNAFYNEKYDEKYYPDFIIDGLDRPLFIEYYGYYDYTIDLIRIPYYEKTKRKNEFYKSKNNIYFIDLYPSDLKNSFQGVKLKLAPFLLK